MDHWLQQVFDHPTPQGCVIIAAKTVLIYLFLILGLRLLGKRELGQMNLFDLILLIVLGNAVQNAMMNGDNSLMGGLIAATCLLLINRAFNWAMKRSKHIEQAMVGEPVLLLRDGKILEQHMVQQGISHDQLMQALREHGMCEPGDAGLCVLEVDGSISVVPTGQPMLNTKRHFKALRLN